MAIILPGNASLHDEKGVVGISRGPSLEVSGENIFVWDWGRLQGSANVLVGVVKEPATF